MKKATERDGVFDDYTGPNPGETTISKEVERPLVIVAHLPASPKTVAYLSPSLFPASRNIAEIIQKALVSRDGTKPKVFLERDYSQKEFQSQLLDWVRGSTKMYGSEIVIQWLMRVLGDYLQYGPSANTADYHDSECNLLSVLSQKELFR